ncbi:chromosome segregation protein SMC [Actinomadura craniellae]|uniref:Chromosome segregation protein SMC n=1 Tax=Actinomadura craniellae TaxID=2231787 RepID=A0A365H2V1_9ACTN|nr:AAA family ATPase [Actinomadura craniellae]RAY13346.1 chromosome segregation protein SMC [Actinomadura craniellae]
MAARSARPVPFVKRIRIKNYRSIAECDVSLGPLTVLLGFNASGKSNFLDALRFVADALTTTPEQAIDGRGGLDSLLCAVPERADSFEIRLELVLDDGPEGDGFEADYGFEIRRDHTGELPFVISWERLDVEWPEGPVGFTVESGLLVQVPGPGDPVPVTRQGGQLHLPVLAATQRPFAHAAASLRRMCFYDFDPAMLCALDDTGTRHGRMRPLGPAGEYLGRVLGELELDEPPVKERLDGYLSALVPGALGVDERREGRYSTVQARFQVGDTDETEVFLRESLSEGTVRAAGVLAALFQYPVFHGRVPLVGIEEPETALHPATVGGLYEALHDASSRTQVIVTSQSSDLLDNEYADPSHIRVVENVDGLTRVGEIDQGGRAVLDKGLMTLAELHRSGQMRPEAG